MEGEGSALRVVVRGGRRLEGRLRVQGAKNAVLPLLAACLLGRAPCRLLDVPDLADVRAMVAILRHLGAAVAAVGAGEQPGLEVDASALCRDDPPAALTSPLRASLLVLGPLLARLGRARLAWPGGCAIGERPVDLHLQALRALGASVRVDADGIAVQAMRLRGADIRLAYPSVGATEHAMMAATAAEGATTIRNAAREPEVVDLQRFLQAMGASVEGAGGDVVVVRGPARLGSACHTVLPDRVEAGTWLLATAIAGGQVELAHAVPAHLQALSGKLAEVGFPVRASTVGLVLEAAGRPRPTCLQTAPYPGFPTDLQNPFMALLLRATGPSRVAETVFEHRFRVVPGFRRMGAEIAVHGHIALVRGVPQLHGAEVEDGDDLRGTAALVLAALAADGVTVVQRAECLHRGHADFPGQLRRLGADVRAEALRPTPAPGPRPQPAGSSATTSPRASAR